MSESIAGGLAVELPVKTGESLKIGYLGGTYTAVAIAGRPGLPEALATNANTSQTLGPWAQNIVVRLSTSANGRVEYAVGKPPVFAPSGQRFVRTSDGVPVELKGLGANAEYLAAGSSPTAPASLAASGSYSTSLTEGTRYESAAPTVTGGVPPYAFGSAGGALPYGMRIDPDTGVLYGVPSFQGSFGGAKVRVTDQLGSFIDITVGTITVAAPSGGGGSYTPLPTVGTVVFFGDSITNFKNASTNANGWTSRVAGFMGATLTNQGIDGTVLQNSADSGGGARANNGRDRFVAALTGGAKRDAVWVNYGFNDARYTAAPSTLNVANYENDLNEVIAGLRILGYPANRIFITAPYWISDVGLNTGTSGFSGQTRGGYEAFVAAAQRVAQANGTWYCDLYSAMRDNGGDSLIGSDNIHPEDPGHLAIATFARDRNSQLNTLATAGISGTGGTNVIDWTITAAPGASSYEIQRATENAFAFGNTVTTSSLTGQITGLSGGTYRLRVRPNYGGSYGPWTYAASASVVTASGGGSFFLDDTFTDTDGVAILSHTAEVGGTPVVQTGFTPAGGGSVIGGNRLYARGAAGVYQYPSATPPSQNYEVAAYLDCLSEVANEDIGIAIRMHPSIGNLVFMSYQRSSGQWRVLQTQGVSTNTPLGTNVSDTVTTGTHRKIKLAGNGTAITATIYSDDETTVIGTITGTAADQATGFPGIRHQVTTGGTQSISTGIQITRIVAGALGST